MKRKQYCNRRAIHRLKRTDSEREQLYRPRLLIMLRGILTR